MIETFGGEDAPVAVSAAAAAYARLTHPGIVRAIEAFVDGGRMAVAMEAVEGTTLDVFRATIERKELDVGHASWVYVVSCAFDALAAAHSARGADGHPLPILHRGIAPSGIHLTWSGDVKLGRFDLGSGAATGRDSSRVQRAPSRYLAPEQAKQQPPGPAADVYSLTLVLWELLTKRKVGEASARPLEAIDGEIETGVRAVIQAGLEPEESKRTLGAARAAALLRAAIEVESARRELVQALSRARGSGGSISMSVPSISPAAVMAAPPRAAAAPPSAPASLPVPSEASAAQTLVKELSLAQTAFAERPPVSTAAPPLPPPRRSSAAEISLAQTALAPAPDASLAPTAVLAPAAAAREPSAPGREPSRRDPELARPEDEVPAPAREASAPAAGAPALGSDVDRWFQSLRPPTPGGFASMAPGAPTEPPTLSPAERERLDRRRKMARKIVFGCMAGSLCIVFAAIGVRAWAAVKAPRTAAVAAAAATQVAPPPVAPGPAAAPPSPAAAPAPVGAAPPASATAPASPVARAAAPIPRTMGELRLPPSAAGHRLFVDNRAVADAGSRVRVACGRHTVRIGSGGRKQTVNVPCGGTVDVAP